MKPYQALIWNEWRQMRGNVIALAGVTVLLWLVLVFGYFYGIYAEYIEKSAAALMLGLPLLYSIVLADSFAREFGQKTDSFLLELPVSPTKIFFCKYLANLTAFLTLSIIITLTMSLMLYYSINQISGRDSIQIEPLLFIVTSCCIPVHSMVFMASLLGRKTGNGIVAIIIIPLLYVILLFGTMSATMFFVKNDSTWGISGILMALIILYCFCIGFGWYLWTCRLACGRKILKPVIATSSILLITPVALFGMAYFYASHSYNSAISNASAAGLETDYFKKLRLPPVPAEQNADPGILEFGNEYNPAPKALTRKNQKSISKIPMQLPSENITGPSWTSTDFNGENRAILSRKGIFETTNYILNDPHINQCYIILAEALKKPYCQLAHGSSQHYSTAAVFLSNRAYALRVAGRDSDFFECITGIGRIANALTDWPYALTKKLELKLENIEYQTAIAAGPDTQESIKFYHEMIRKIDSINPALTDKVYQYDYLKDLRGWFNPKYRDRSEWGWALLILPREFYWAAARIRWEIQRYKLLKQASACTSIKAIEPEVISLENSLNTIPDKFDTSADIRDYFVWRSKFESYKLCLALKIYHIKYGKFPDSLQQLVPEILPKIPVNPETGKDYIYKPEANGFNLSGYENVAGIRYQTWDIKPEIIK